MYPINEYRLFWILGGFIASVKWWFLGALTACYLDCKVGGDLVVSSVRQPEVLKMKIYSHHSTTKRVQLDRNKHKQGIVKCECFDLDQKVILYS